MDEPENPDHAGLSPETAFSLLANETRLSTIEALWEAWEDDPVPFSVLRRHVGVRDAGQFHYHLKKLQDHYVRKKEETEISTGDENASSSAGYELTAAGFKVAQSIVAGTGIDAPVIDAETLDEECPRCEGAVELSYEDGMVRTHCLNCPGFWTGTDEYGSMSEGYLGGWEFPPAGLGGRSPTGLLDASILYMVTRSEALMAGVCPDCGGTVEGTLTVCDDHDPDDGVCSACGRQFLGAVRWRCEVCKLFFAAPSWAVAIQHPSVRSILVEEGIDYRDDPWRAVNAGYDREWDETVVTTEPLRVRITVDVGNGTRELLLDESGSVIDVTQ